MKLLFLLAASIIIGATAICLNPTEGKKIAHFDKGSYIFDADTVALKSYWQKIITVPGVKLNKIAIQKSKTWGDKQEDFYMLIAYDSSKNLKMCRWLVKDGNDFYLYKNTGENLDNEIFYRTYYHCYGTDTDCFPQVMFMDNEYVWTGSQSTICPVDNPCKGGVSFLPNEL